MSKLRAGALACLALAAVAAAPARAQEPPPESSTIPPDTTLPTDTTVPVDPTLPVDPNESTTSTTTADDPLVGEGPPETVPEETFTIPPRTPVTGFYADQGAFASHPGRLVRVNARTARARAAETQAALDAAIASRDLLVLRSAQLNDELGRLAVEERAAIEALEDAQLELELRATDAYIRGNIGPVTVLLSSTSASDYYHRRELLQAVVNADEEALYRFQEARRAVDDNQARAASELAQVSQELLNAEQAVAAATLEHELASRELAVFLAGGTVVIHGFVFPVAGETNFIDSFGFPRMTGTPYEHWHEGTDIFTPAGTELVACERGVITRMGTNVLGGITLWLRGESGVSYYYAHLSGFAPGITTGMVVEASTVVGYAGNTGNAATTPPHLHFEVHPRNSPAVNPFPLLDVAVDQPQPPPIRLQ
jgi:murein DD-endopeptidase MepM/ murein hydrolase activator NlpD